MPGGGDDIPIKPTALIELIASVDALKAQLEELLSSCDDDCQDGDSE